MQHPLPIEKAEQSSQKREWGDLALNIDEKTNNIRQNISLKIRVICIVRPLPRSWGDQVKLTPPPTLPPIPDPRLSTIQRLQDGYYDHGEGDPRVHMSSISLREQVFQVAQRMYGLDIFTVNHDGISIKDKEVWKRINTPGNNLQFHNLIQNDILPTVRKAIGQFLAAVRRKCLFPKLKSMLTRKNQVLIARLKIKLETLEYDLELFHTLTKTREEIIKAWYLLFITKNKTHKDYRDRLQVTEEELKTLRRNIQQKLISVMAMVAIVEEEFTDYIPWDEGIDVRPREVFPSNKPNGVPVDVHRHSDKKAVKLHKRKSLTPYPMEQEGLKNLDTQSKAPEPPKSGIHKILGLLTGSRGEALQTVSTTEQSDAPKTVYEQAKDLLERIKNLNSSEVTIPAEQEKQLRSDSQRLKALLTPSRRMRKIVDSTKIEQPVNIANLNSAAAQVSMRGIQQRECDRNEVRMRELIEDITAQLSALEEAA